MEKEENRIRKVRAAAGTRTQKHTAFRLDLDLAGWLSTMPNKGRYINDLIRADRDKHR